MIWRLLLLVLLLGGGFGTLYYLTQDDAAARGKGAREGLREQEPGKTLPKPIIRVAPNERGGAIGHRMEGPMRIPRKRSFLMPDGSTRLAKVYEIVSKDSRTEPNNTQLLIGVTVRFFRAAQQGGEVRTSLIGTMRASRARLHLSQDKQDNALIAEDKQMTFEDVVFDTTADAAVRNATIKVRQLAAMNTKHDVRLWTPREDEPVSIVARGIRGFTIDGRGLQVFVTAARDAVGSIKIAGSDTIRFSVLSDPILVQGNTTLSSSGTLDYEEVPGSGVAIVTMLEQVQVLGLGPSRKGSRQSLVGEGDRLRATLARERDALGEMVWNRITLHGTPARVHGAEMELTCDQLDAFPDLDGEPSWLMASGTTPKMVYRGDQVSTPGRIHLIRPVQIHAALLGSFGFQAGSIPDAGDNLVIFDAQTTLIAPSKDLNAKVSRGLTILRSSAEDRTAPVVFLGRGDVEIQTRTILAKGNRGFRLWQKPDVNGNVVRDILLGKATDRNARYVITHTPATKTQDKTKDQPFEVSGTGSARIKIAEGSSKTQGMLELLSENGDIRGRLLDDLGDLTGVESLTANFTQRGSKKDTTSELTDLVAKGAACAFVYGTKDEVLRGRAREIRMPTADRVELHDPARARLVRTPRSDASRGEKLEGRTVVAQRLGGDDLMFLARGDALLHGRHTQARKKGEVPKDDADKKNKPSELDIELKAEEILALPYLVPPHALVHADLLPRDVRPLLLGNSETSRHLMAKGKVRIVHRDEKGRAQMIGHGDELVLRANEGDKSLAGRLSGPRTKLVSLDGQGRENVAKANLILFSHDERGDYLSLIPKDGVLPEFQIPQLGSSIAGTGSVDAAGRTIVVCDGRVEVEPLVVRFEGPVKARGLDTKGQPDPTGIRMDAHGLVLHRNATGGLDRMVANREIRFWWGEVSGQGDNLTINPTNNLLILRGALRPARLTLGSGGQLRAAQLNYNYLSGAIKLWDYRVEVGANK